MKLRLIITGLGNLIDTIATLYFVGLGYYEINPIMRHLLNYPLIFIETKIILMTTSLVWLWNARNNKSAIVASWIASIMYGSISIYYGLLSIMQLL